MSTHSTSQNNQPAGLRFASGNNRVHNSFNATDIRVGSNNNRATKIISSDNTDLTNTFIGADIAFPDAPASDPVIIASENNDMSDCFQQIHIGRDAPLVVDSTVAEHVPNHGDKPPPYIHSQSDSDPDVGIPNSLMSPFD